MQPAGLKSGQQTGGVQKGFRGAAVENHNRAVKEALDKAKMGDVIDLTSLMASKEQFNIQAR